MFGTGHNDDKSKIVALRAAWAGMRNCHPRDWNAEPASIRSVSSESATAACAPSTSADENAVALIALAASAGGLLPLLTIVSSLPRQIAAAVVVVQHIGLGSKLAGLLQTHCQLPVAFAVDGDLLEPGRVYVCPPSSHLIVGAERHCVLRSATARPAPSVNWLFRSMAATYGEAAIGVVLSGALSDGADGIVRIAKAGGVTIAQEPSTCDFPDMARAALLTNFVRTALPPERIAGALIEFVSGMDVDRLRRQFQQPFCRN